MSSKTTRITKREIKRLQQAAIMETIDYASEREEMQAHIDELKNDIQFLQMFHSLTLDASILDLPKTITDIHQESYFITYDKFEPYTYKKAVARLRELKVEIQKEYYNLYNAGRGPCKDDNSIPEGADPELLF